MLFYLFIEVLIFVHSGEQTASVGRQVRASVRKRLDRLQHWQRGHGLAPPPAKLRNRGHRQGRQ